MTVKAKSKRTLLSAFLYSTLVYFKASSAFEGIRRHDNESWFSSLQRDISFVCLTGNICKENSSSLVPPPGKTHCCKECSCTQDCGLSQNCCFPADDIYLLVDRTKYECIFPTTLELDSYQKARYKSYYMITDNPHNESSKITHGDNKTDNSLESMAIPCGERTVFPWGRLLPVFSKSTGVIYKNEHCANEHGIKDGVKWLIGMICKITDEYGNNIINTEQVFEDLLQSKELNNTCSLYFYYPGDKNDIATEQCFQDLTSSCNNPNLQVPAGWNMTVNEIREACESGFTSPYVAARALVYTGEPRNVYRNAFCAICHGKYQESIVNPWCNDFMEVPWLRRPPSEFTLLIDYDYLKNLASLDHGSGYRYRACLQQGACSEKTKDFTDCRDIKCPSGQLRRFDGKCFYIMKTFEVSVFSIYIKLTPRFKVELRHVVEMRRNNTSSKFKYPKLKLKVDVDFYFPKPHTWQMNASVDHILAHFSCNSPPRKFRLVLKQLEEQFAKLWFMEIDAVWVELIPEFSEFAHLERSSSHLSKYYKNCTSLNYYGTFCNHEHFFFPSGSDPADENSPRWFPMYFNRYARNGIILTKLHYCNQIEIMPSEYILRAYDSSLYSTITKRRLFNGEFAVVTDSTGNRIARVCLEDSHFLAEEPLKSVAETHHIWSRCYKKRVLKSIDLMTFYLIMTWLLAN